MTATRTAIMGPVWEEFSQVVKVRLSRFGDDPYDFSLSEENFRLDFGVALAKRWDYAYKVFAEYPCDLEPSQKLDLFLDEDPGYCFEFKFFRPIPSERNPPFTQHLGSLWSDVVKLRNLCRQDRERFLVVFADDRFKAYFARQSAFPLTESETLELTLDITAMGKTLRRTITKRLPRVDLPDSVSVVLVNRRTMVKGPFHGYLLQIS